MSLYLKGNPRPILTLLSIIAVGVVIGMLIKGVGYFWVIVIPNMFALALTLVMLLAFIESEGVAKAQRRALPMLSVIVPSYNSKTSIIACIDSIRNADYPGEMEIIVVDDGSSDGSREMLKSVKGITLLLMEVNKGKASAINSAMRIAKGEVVACVDSDSYPEPSAFREGVSMLMDNENIGVVTCFIRVAHPDNILKKLQDIEYLTGFGFFQLGARFLDAITVAPGPTSIFRKSVLLEVGGFDEENITEDLEIAWRLRKHGYDIEYTPHAVSYTEVPGDLYSLLKQRVRWYRGKFFNIRKHQDVLFNQKYGLFSMFVLPFSFSAELSGVALSFSFLYIIANQVSWTAQYMGSMLALGEPFVFGTGGIVAVSMSTLVMSLLLMSPWFIVIYLSYLLGNKKFGLGEIPVIGLFFLFYGLIISFFYSVTFFKEVNRSDYTWK
ncbi:Glycosyltransferase AglI [uncultured archaeon]|nr:Glycosyltransferase AglI [uncultured archaeon]